MTNKRFNEIVEDQLIRCKNILISKGVEYTENEDTDDRLHSFTVAAVLEGITPKEALAGMMVKHTVSIYDMCRDPQYHSLDKWHEKITDHINYLLLLAAMVEEEVDKRVGLQ